MNNELKYLMVNNAGLLPGECEGKVVVVTGAGRGIGAQAARAFAALGGKVVIAERSEQGNQVAREICAEGGEALYVQTDVSNAEAVDTLKEIVRNRYGPADILVNNAIRIQVSLVAEMLVKEWDEIIAVNLRGTFLTCKAFLPEMLSRNTGVIVNMVSTDAMPGLSAYIASKQGITGFSQSLAVELSTTGVRVIPFGPGMVDTPGINEAAVALAPQLNMTQEQFKTISLHPAYEGFMPPEHAGVATVYLALRLADDYHGQVVYGYEVLERAGVIQPVIVETPTVDHQPTGKNARNLDLLHLVEHVATSIDETEQEFGKLPAFVRPLARSGFKGKAGQSLRDWQLALGSLHKQLESGSSLKEASPNLPERLEKLIVYYQGVPSETARFTRDREMLARVSQLCSQRIAAIRLLIEACRK